MSVTDAAKRGLAHAVRGALGRPRIARLAYEEVRPRAFEVVLHRLQRAGVRLQVVYDIGAFDGGWTRAARTVLPGAQFFLFEANAALAATLDEGTVFNVVLASAPGVVAFYSNGSTGDSYYRERTPNYESVTPTMREATTLDAIVEESELPLPDLIKIDVQGAELDVLSGGSRALEHASVAMLECPLLDYNEGAPSIDRYFEFMDDRGFTVLEFLDGYAFRGRLTHVDVLFGRVGLS